MGNRVPRAWDPPLCEDLLFFIFVSKSSLYFHPECYIRRHTNDGVREHFVLRGGAAKTYGKHECFSRTHSSSLSSA